MLNRVKILFNTVKVQAYAKEELVILVGRPDKYFCKVYYIFT